MTRAVAYLRVSTDKQADSGLGLEAQRAKVDAYAALYDVTLVDVVVEPLSGKNMDRPKLHHALSLLRSGAADALLVMKLDRLTRSVRDMGTLLDDYFGPTRPYSMLSVEDHLDTRTAAGRMVINIMMSVFQWEREATGERTRVALKVIKDQGRHVGAIPRIGRVVDRPAPRENGTVPAGRLEVDHATLGALHRARAMGKGWPTLAALAESLTGRQWAPGTVRATLARYPMTP